MSAASEPSDEMNIDTPDEIYFQDPAALSAHLDAGSRITTQIVLSVGTHCKTSDMDNLTARQYIPAMENEMTAWGDALVRISKLPSFNVRTVIFDICPGLDCGFAAAAFYRLLTRASTAVWRAEGRKSWKESNCVFVVKGWTNWTPDAAEKLANFVVGVKFAAVDTIPGEYGF